MLLSVAASPPPELAPHPALWLAGQVLAALAALALAASRHLPPRATFPAAAAAATLAGLALCALYARNPALAPSPFTGANAALLGLPSAFPFLLLAAGAAALRTAAARTSPLAPAALGLFGVGLLWGTATLALPDPFLGVARHPLATALSALTSGAPLDLLAGLARLSLLLPLALAWRWAWTRLRPPRRAPAPPAPPRGVALAALALVAFHALAAPLAPAPLPGLLLAATLGLALAALAALLRARAAAPARDRAGRLADAALLTLPLLAFAVLKTHAMGPSNTDENIYFYMAADLAHGRWPYLDYFFAHPPLHVLVPGAAFALFGYSLTLAKSFSVLAAALAGAAVFAIARRHLGRAAAALALVFFLFATETLKASSNMTGVNLTVMWLALGLWQSLRGRGFTAGLLFGAAATTGFYSMAGVLAALTLGLFRPSAPSRAPRSPLRARFGVRQLAGFALVFGGVNLLFIALAGDAYLDAVYGYHGLKALQDPRMVELFGGELVFPLSLFHNVALMVEGREFTKELFYHAHLWVGLLAAPLVGAAAYFAADERRPWTRFFSPARLFDDGAHGVAGLAWLVALALFVQYAMFRELYSFYFVLIYPTLALLLAYALAHGARLAVTALASPPTRRAAARFGMALSAIVVVAASRPWSAGLQSVFADEIETTGARNDYTWTPAPVLPELSDLVRTLAWEDYRLKGDIEPGYRHYLWTKKRGFASLDEVAAWVRAHSAPSDTIAGASTMAPLVALAAERRLAANEADTNNKRFKTGLLKDADYWDAICADGVKLIIATSRSYFTRERMESLPTARRWFRLAHVVEDPELTYGGVFPIALYERVGDPPAPGRVCRWEGPRD